MHAFRTMENREFATDTFSVPSTDSGATYAVPWSIHVHAQGQQPMQVSSTQAIRLSLVQVVEASVVVQ